MRGCCFRRAVDLDQHEPRRIVLLLDHFDARNPGFLNASAGVFDGSLPEAGNRLGFDPHMHVNDKHRTYSPFLILTPHRLSSVAHSG